LNLRFAAQPARRGAARTRTWWGKSWVRAVEEAAYGEHDLRAGRTLARSGRIGAITLSASGFVAAVEDPSSGGDGMWAVAGQLPQLGERDTEAFCEVVEAESGRVAALLAGELPHTLVEHAEEAGVEVLPYGTELSTSCSCDNWADPCPHALAVLYQLAWLIDDDPFVLLHLRGLPRADLLTRLDERAAAADSRRTPSTDPEQLDLDTAVDAALRAARIIELANSGESIDHLL